MNVFAIEYRKTKCYFIELDNGLFTIDAFWPGRYIEYARLIKEKGWKVENIKWMIVTHFHIDHAGLVGELMSRGVEVKVFENQIDGIREMEDFLARKNTPYMSIDKSRISVLKATDSRQWLESIGIKGEIIETKGHSKDSITLVLDNGVAFTGDLYPENQIMDEDLVSRSSWEEIHKRGGRLIKPAHGIEYELTP